MPQHSDSDALISIRVDGKPVAFARPRFRNGRGFNTPEYAEGKRALARLLERAMHGRPPVAGPVEVELVFSVGPLPQTHKRKKLTGEMREHCMIQGAYLTGSDVDNYAKTVLDAGNGIVWVDDVQVVRLVANKCYGVEYTSIVVREMG